MPVTESEYGGKGVQKNGVYPSPHVPTESERLSLLYRTGDESGLTDPDNGEVWSGLRSAETQRQVRAAEGHFDKGQEWEKLSQEAEGELSELKPTEPQ